MRKNSRHRITKRKTEAVDRQNKWDGVSPADQIKALDKRLGKGIGAVKQRARLAKKMG